VVGSAVPEIDQSDDGRHRQTVADDCKRPGVAGIPLEDQSAGRTAIEVVGPA
jgi:hypothetical protein